MSALAAACGPSDPAVRGAASEATPPPPPPAAGELPVVGAPELVPPPEPDITDLYPYPLDEVSREVAPTGRVTCPEVGLTRYRGDIIRYHKPVTVYTDFVGKLRTFEQVVHDTAIEFYGRPPRRIKHLGTYYCRRIRAWPTYISEHGLGNAIDVEGFDFAWASRKQAPGVPARLRQSFQIRVEKHWNGRGKTGSVHSRFLHTLAQRLVDDEGLFRVMLGPAEPGHQDHFHFDVAPWRIVNIFEEPVIEAADLDS